MVAALSWSYTLQALLPMSRMALARIDIEVEKMHGHGIVIRYSSRLTPNLPERPRRMCCSARAPAPPLRGLVRHSCDAPDAARHSSQRSLASGTTERAIKLREQIAATAHAPTDSKASAQAAR